MLNDVAIHRSKPPLRWIANWAGSIASKNMLELSYMEDEGLDKRFRYKYYGWLWDTFWPIYSRYGTFYTFDMSDKAWDDYDENGIPYWEKTGVVDPDYSPDWDYEDPNGDAFRVVRRRNEQETN